MSRKRIFTSCLLLFAVALSAHMNRTSAFGQAKPPAGDASTAGQAEPDNAEPSTAGQVFANKWDILPAARGVPNGVAKEVPKDWMDAVSDVHWVPPATDACDENTCSLAVPIPPNVKIEQVRCWTNAGGIPGDHQISPMMCGNEDRGWSTFDAYKIDRSLGYIWLVKTAYHNRSGNRERVIALEVLYKP